MEALSETILNIKSNKDNILKYDEARTKNGVVLKILGLLGWDSRNVDEVYPEYGVDADKPAGAGKPFGAGKVDYSLRIDKVNKVFLEVKKPCEELEKVSHQEQLLNYSFKQGVRLAILTNGLTWWFYLPSNEGTWEERNFCSIDLLQQEIDDIASKFDDFLSKGNIKNGNAYQNAEAAYKNKQKLNKLQETIVKAWEKIITEPNKRLIEIINEITEGICSYKADDGMIREFLKFLNKHKGYKADDEMIREFHKFLNKHKENLPNSHEKTNHSETKTQQIQITNKANIKTRRYKRDKLLLLIYNIGEEVTREQICREVPKYWELEPYEKEIEKRTNRPFYWHNVSNSLQQLKDKDGYLEKAGHENWKITNEGYEYIRKKLLL